MKITYDEEVDAMYIQLIDGDHQCRTVSLNDDVALDFDARERLVGIEILDAKRVIGKGKLPKVVADRLMMTAGTTAERVALPATAPDPRPRPSRAMAKSTPRVRKAS